jgi:hypothetical protein
MNGFCDDCKHLKDSLKSRGKHFCNKYNKQVKHLEHHKEIVRLEECINDSLITKEIEMAIMKAFAQIGGRTMG